MLHYIDMFQALSVCLLIYCEIGCFEIALNTRDGNRHLHSLLPVWVLRSKFHTHIFFNFLCFCSSSNIINKYSHNQIIYQVHIRCSTICL
ncbi:hypothetical protein QVD17_18583 [Tagetes erecta]|uniref:Uncharacterized protein n=1 Tax=Tagetes erecta TaxID=13708 RepID=A0AAD8NP74_TARER|nr:hypothetical protein QVD17_18583 [Tagetes erecta]